MPPRDSSTRKDVIMVKNGFCYRNLLRVCALCWQSSVDVLHLSHPIPLPSLSFPFQQSLNILSHSLPPFLSLSFYLSLSLCLSLSLSLSLFICVSHILILSLFVFVSHILILSLCLSLCLSLFLSLSLSLSLFISLSVSLSMFQSLSLSLSNHHRFTHHILHFMSRRFRSAACTMRDELSMIALKSADLGPGLPL